MKRIFLIHGWDGFPENHWFPWLKRELEKIGFKVIVPAMPNSPEPQIERWVSHLKKIVGKLDEETYFVGHSIGCQTILRCLEKENFNGKIPAVVFVAGWFNLDNLEDDGVKEIAKPWINTPIHFEKVKSKVKKFVVFLSTDEPYGYVKENERTFKEKLGAEVIIEENKGHFTNQEIPEVLKIIKNYTQ